MAQRTMRRRFTLQATAAVGLLLVGFSLGAVSSARASASRASTTTLQAILDAVEALTSGLRPPSNGQTRLLLFRVVAQVPSVNTSVEIFNTGRDPYGTAGVTGSCEIRFYGIDGVVADGELVRVTPPIAPGTSFSLDMVSGNPVAGITPINFFEGYAIATCGFPLAHGEVITDTPDGHSTRQAVILPSARSTSFVEAGGH